jgi:hypothetical protein
MLSSDQTTRRLKPTLAVAAAHAERVSLRQTEFAARAALMH